MCEQHVEATELSEASNIFFNKIIVSFLSLHCIAKIYIPLHVTELLKELEDVLLENAPKFGLVHIG